MTVALGIHCGHEASCAVVADGVVLAAAQQERDTRVKYDGQECLSDRLPIHQVLRSAGLGIGDVDVIVTSFQAAGPSAVGLQRPLFTTDFTAFDPFDPRHMVVSHHLAHAASAAYTSGYSDAAVLVSDSAGSTTYDGDDYYLPFVDFHRLFTADGTGRPVMTEMRSIYRYSSGRLALLERDFSQPHNQPDVYVQSEASLFDNLSRFVFRAEHAHGQFMALSALPVTGTRRLTASDILSDGPTPRFRNDWQQIRPRVDPADNADIAAAAQEAFTASIVMQARRALKAADADHICCGGGVFLNLDGNSAIAAMPEVDDVYIPSAPHDAGIAIGAAYLGLSGVYSEPRMMTAPRLLHDHLGPRAEVISSDTAHAHGFTTAVSDEDTCEKLVHRAAELMLDGAVVARYAGRSEFGPRALGNRSILAHPTGCVGTRARLNAIKRRQDWRPVAPIVRVEDVSTYFDGPRDSPFMNYNFTVLPQWRDVLAEALHADGTARLQTVTAQDSPALHRLLGVLDEMGAVPVLINTSLNGPAQPIIEGHLEAMDFVRSTSITHLLTDTALFEAPPDDAIRLRRAPGVALAAFGDIDQMKFTLTDTTATEIIDRRLFEALTTSREVEVPASDPVADRCRRAGLLVVV